MVRLSLSPVLDVSPLPERPEEVKGKRRRPQADSPRTVSALQQGLAAAASSSSSSSPTPSQPCEGYLEEGLLLLKHKIRNIEKKRLKLDDYRKRLKDGEKLNRDQMDAVDKYEEVVQNLMFAKDLQKSLGALSQELLKTQRKVVRREQAVRAEAEKKRLGSVLHVRHVLLTLQQEHVRRDLRSGQDHAPFLGPGEIEHLLDLAALVGCKREETMRYQATCPVFRGECPLGGYPTAVTVMVLGFILCQNWLNVMVNEISSDSVFKLAPCKATPLKPEQLWSCGGYPTLRKQQLQDLMEQIQGSFSFMQSTPLPVRLLSTDSTTNVTNEGQPPVNPDPSVAVDQVSDPPPDDAGPAPPLPAQPVSSAPISPTASMAAATPLQDTHIVLANTPLPPRSELDQKPDASALSDSYSLSVSTASTQTPPEASLLDQANLQPVTSYQSECPVGNSYQVYLSPCQPSGVHLRSSQPYYGRGAIRGTARGSRGLSRSPGGYKGGLEGYRTGLRSLGGSSVPHSSREITPVLYGFRETGYQHSYKRGSGTGGQRNSSRVAWNDMSQVSSSETDSETFASVDSGHGDSRCITPIDAPAATQGSALTPVHVFQLAQQMRVAFSAARTVNFAPGALDQTITFDLLHSNLGDAFDAHLGRFTCPADGTYVFIFHILKLAVNVPLYVNLMRNEEVMVSAYANDGAPDHETASNHAVLQLRQGDRVWLRLHRGAIYGSSWKYSTFSGYLLYQD
ncbi:caprin-2-like [Megalops cyprinoides]|uniref:caprin-2-like n=1 Tax=Megalops cyprinoides TaxID=118141 RepID=UPI001864CB8D|nr:caprin-2-like [Megalops cyprinoides]